MSNLYKIKWTGRSTNGNWRREFKADDMWELYNKLLNDGSILSTDYDPYEKYQIEKSGQDYYEFMNSFSNEDYEIEEEMLREAIDKLPDLNDDEIEDLIVNEDGNAYYQTFKYLYDVEVTFIHKGEDIVRGLYLYAGDDEQAEESAKEELEEYLYEDCNVEINDVVIKSIKVVKQL